MSGNLPNALLVRPQKMLPEMASCQRTTSDDAGMKKARLLGEVGLFGVSLGLRWKSLDRFLAERASASVEL
jgi:hypothetical protein